MKKKIVVLFYLILAFLLIFPSWAEVSGRVGEEPHAIELEIQGMVVADVPFTLSVKALDGEGRPVRDFRGPVRIHTEKSELTVLDRTTGDRAMGEITEFVHGKAVIENLSVSDTGENKIIARWKDLKTEKEFRAIPGYLTILPPLLAIILALTIRQVVVSLLFGVWLGSAIMYGFNPLNSLMKVIDTTLINALADRDHICIIVFSLFLGGMVAVVSRSGGNHGMVNVIKKWAGNARSAQIATWGMGLLIFFDDYANTLLVGNAMRPLTDKMKISREKLSFIVDATAAPVTSIALISTWIGFEISIIGDSLRNLGVGYEPYMVFIQSISYRFYPVLLLVFIFMVAYMMRDFGPMLRAEVRARRTGQLLRPNAKPLSTLDSSDLLINEDVPQRWYNAVIPIVSVVVFTIWGLWYTGTGEITAQKGAEALANVRLYEILSNADSFKVLLWASFGGSLVAILLVIFQKIMNLENAISTWTEGVKSLIPAVVILSLAWGIGGMCKDLKTAEYLSLLARGNLPYQLLPATIFVLSALIAFATGTSWGTMSIVMPIAVYIGYHLPPAEAAESVRYSILLGSIAGVLAGSTFGDHCSPISDTTIMSSMASACDHIDHVRTQMPYAITVGLTGTLLGSIPAGYGLNPWISMLICTAVLYVILITLGKNPETLAQKAGGGMSMAVEEKDSGPGRIKDSEQTDAEDEADEIEDGAKRKKGRKVHIDGDPA